MLCFSGNNSQVQIQGAGGPPTPGFETPKIELFRALFNFSVFFFSLASLGIQFLSYFTIFHNLNSEIFQPHFTWHIISQLMQIKSRGLSS